MSSTLVGRPPGTIVRGVPGFFFMPDDAASLAARVRHAIKTGAAQAERARSVVKEYTWKRRAERILAGCAGT